MQTPLTGDSAAVGPDDPRGFWRRAFAGLTPQLLAIIAVLLLSRMLSIGLYGLLDAVRSDALGTWLWETLQGMLRLGADTAFPMLVAIILTANLGPQRGPKRVAALTAAVILSAGVGAFVRRFGIGSGDNLGFDPKGWVESFDRLGFLQMVYVWPRYVILGGMLTIVGELYRHETRSLQATQKAEIEHAAFEREMAEARLEVLQAQIEPHFLFNTLANVRRLHDKDPAAGARMLAHLMRYFEVALPRMRENESTLSRDAELLEAFLCIHQIRMGARLAFSIDIPTGLSSHPVPPMMLLTLVENAIKHGLNPSPDGGLIRVVARAEKGRLILSVADTGVGFAPGSGTGTGLANVRARLAAQFGERASLTLENNDLRGATATLALPLVVSASA